MEFELKRRILFTKLFEWNQESWTGTYFQLEFQYPWVFKISGFRLKPGKDDYLDDCEIKQEQLEHEKDYSKYPILLGKDHNEQLLYVKKPEKSFIINCEEFHDAIRWKYEGEFCLSAIEIFGILRKKE